MVLQFVSAHNLRDTGAVASARAAEIYGLEILMDGIQDDLDNVTRFLMLAREPIIPRTDRPFKVSYFLMLWQQYVLDRFARNIVTSIK
jgi:arogenate/prephenate dehydratase